MKILKPAVLLIVVSFFLSFRGGSNDTSLTLASLKGNVKSLKRSYYKAVGTPGAVTRGSLKYSDSTIYNNKGNMTEYYYFARDPGDNYKTISKFDDKANETERNKFGKSGHILNKYLFKYDDKNNIIEEDMFETFNSNNVPAGKYQFKYDVNGKKTETDVLNMSDYITEKYLFTYDAKGNDILETDINPGAKTKSKISYTYDDKGNAITRNEYKTNGKLDTGYSYKYDDDGKIIEINYNSPDKDKTIYKIIVQFENYDKNGNWLHKTKIGNDEQTEITERQIEYY